MNIPAALHDRRIHGLALIQIHPALHDAVDKPDHVGDQHKPADNQNECDCTDECPQQTKSEGAHLPAEVAFEIGAGHVTPFDIVHHEANRLVTPISNDRA